MGILLFIETFVLFRGYFICQGANFPAFNDLHDKNSFTTLGNLLYDQQEIVCLHASYTTQSNNFSSLIRLAGSTRGLAYFLFRLLWRKYVA